MSRDRVKTKVDRTGEVPQIVALLDPHPNYSLITMSCSYHHYQYYTPIIISTTILITTILITTILITTIIGTTSGWPA